MKGKASERDPFAGYTPVKVSVPVVDIFKQDEEKPSRGKKYKFGGKRESGTLSRTVVLAAVLLVSTALVLVVAAFSFGVIYDKPVQETVPELSSFADDIKPLADAGGVVRRRVADIVENVRASLAEDRKAAEPESAPSREMPPTTNFASVVVSGIAHISTMKERKRSAEASFDPGESKTNAVPVKTDGVVKASKTSETADMEAPVGEQSAQTREIDPRLRKFQGGGQAVRRLGDGNIREFYDGGQRGRSIGDWRKEK